MIAPEIQQRALDELAGDLQAIGLMRHLSRLSMHHNTIGAFGAFGEWKAIGPLSWEGKKRLWNAQSRLITGIERRLFGTLPDPNTVQSILARTLIELSAKQEEGK